MKKIYSLPIKLVSVIVSSVLLWCCCSQVTSLLILRYNEPVYFKNAISQGKNFELETSEPFAQQAGGLVDALLKYTVFYQDTENFSNAAYINKKIEDENKSAQTITENTIYLASLQISENSVMKQYVEDGFISIKPCDEASANVVYDGVPCLAAVDEERIIAFYGAVRDENIELYKKNDEGYRSVCEYIEALDGVSYALKKDGTVMTDLAQDVSVDGYFEKLQHYAVITARDGGLSSSGSVDMSKALDTVQKDYSGDFELYIGFENGLAFNGECKGAAEKAAGVYAGMKSCVIRLVLFAVLFAAAAVFVLLISGKKEEAKLRRLKTDKPVIVALHGALCVGLVAFSLVTAAASARQLGDLTLGTNWLKISATLPALRLKLGVTLSYLYILSFVSFIKRMCFVKKTVSDKNVEEG